MFRLGGNGGRLLENAANELGTTQRLQQDVGGPTARAFVLEVPRRTGGSIRPKSTPTIGTCIQPINLYVTGGQLEKYVKFGAEAEKLIEDQCGRQ